MRNRESPGVHSPVKSSIAFRRLWPLAKRLPLLLAICSSTALIVELGFPIDAPWVGIINGLLVATLTTSVILTLVRHLFLGRAKQTRVLVFDAFATALMAGVVLAVLTEGGADWIRGFDEPLWRNAAVFIVLLREFGARRVDLRQTIFNPAQLFVFSFILIILGGAMMLSLPNATSAGISFIDALFTSTSAVCVTGLTVVDTAKHFTLLGQTIILVLIQIGGLGIMTFASYLTYFFRGGSSFENQLVLSQINQDQRLGEVFHTLKNIILTTLSIEALGALIIYATLPENNIPGLSDRVFYAVFHSISAFCNAGFSTLSNNLYEAPVRYNYGLQGTVAWLIIIGGIGFPILFNVLTSVRGGVIRRVQAIREGRRYIRKPWQINLQTRIVLITTGTLLLAGTILIYLLEQQHTLADHSGYGRWIAAFFNSSTTRTAGFNNVDMTALRFPTVMVIFFLMWVGASPGSTGGGIKTTTFALATLNILSISRGKERIELFRREISGSAVKRAFAVIALSLVMLGFGTFLLAVFDAEKSLYHIAFECFSAYGTVGLSLGITASLSLPGKLVIIALMFTGRVGMLTLMLGFMPKNRHKAYNYPGEEIQTS